MIGVIDRNFRKISFEEVDEIVKMHSCIYAEVLINSCDDYRMLIELILNHIIDNDCEFKCYYCL